MALPGSGVDICLSCASCCCPSFADTVVQSCKSLSRVWRINSDNDQTALQVQTNLHWWPASGASTRSCTSKCHLALSIFAVARYALPLHLPHQPLQQLLEALRHRLIGGKLRKHRNSLVQAESLRKSEACTQSLHAPAFARLRNCPRSS